MEEPVSSQWKLLASDRVKGLLIETEIFGPKSAQPKLESSDYKIIFIQNSTNTFIAHQIKEGKSVVLNSETSF